MSSSLVQPRVTPSTELLTRARTSPWIAALESSSRTTVKIPSFCSSLTPAGMWVVTSPFGPFTRTLSSSMAYVTPFGTASGRREWRDLLFVYPGKLIALVDLAKPFAAHAFLARLAPGHYASGRGQDADPQTAENTRNLGVSDIHAATRTRNPLQVRNRRRVVGAVLQVHPQNLAAFFFGRFEVRDVALFLQDAGHLDLKLGMRNVHLLVPCLDGIANAGH